MSTSHHGNEFTPEERRRQEETMRRFLDQVEGRAAREYPEGRISAADDGALAFAVAADPKTGTVILDFGKPVNWIGLKPQDVAQLCTLLMRKAREVSKEPLTVSL